MIWQREFEPSRRELPVCGSGEPARGIPRRAPGSPRRRTGGRSILAANPASGAPHLIHDHCRTGRTKASCRRLQRERVGRMIFTASSSCRSSATHAYVAAPVLEPGGLKIVARSARHRPRAPFRPPGGGGRRFILKSSCRPCETHILVSSTACFGAGWEAAAKRVPGSGNGCAFGHLPVPRPGREPLLPPGGQGCADRSIVSWGGTTI